MTSYNPTNLLKRCKKGDEKAFAMLCQANYDYAYRVAFRMLANEEDTKDAVQEAFIRVWKKISTFNEKIKFTTWLYSIVTNHCIDKLRKKKKYSDINCNEALDQFSLSNEEDQFSKKDLASIIAYLANELSPKQHAIFVLRDLEGLEMDEIAKITELSATQVKSNLCHARKAIREKLVTMYKVDY